MEELFEIADLDVTTTIVAVAAWVYRTIINGTIIVSDITTYFW